jgi:hypothetical protein
MQYQGNIAGLIFGLMGMASGVTCALTAVVARTPISGVWFGLFGATIGVMCAAAGVAIYYAESKRRQRDGANQQ